MLRGQQGNRCCCIFPSLPYALLPSFSHFALPLLLNTIHWSYLIGESIGRYENS